VILFFNIIVQSDYFIMHVGIVTPATFSITFC